MKKLSAFKKIRLAFMAEGWLEKLLVFVYPLMIFWMLFDDEDVFSIFGMVCYSMVISAMYVCYTSFTMANLKMYKTMPMMTEDIVDIMSLHSLIGVLLNVLMQTAALAAFGRFDMLPYFLCADCVTLAVNLLNVIWPAKDKYAYANVKEHKETEQVVKKKTRRAAIMATVYILSEAAVFFLIILQGRNPDLSADAIWLSAVAAAGIIGYTVISLCVRKIKNAFIY